MAHPTLSSLAADGQVAFLRSGSTPSIRITQLAQVFERDRPPVLDRIDLEVMPGEFVCLLGASGCGKSTLLSLIAGLGAPTSGSVEVTVGRPALMFQEPALLPWLTAAGNVELALRARGVWRRERHAEAERLLTLVNLPGRGASGFMSSPVGCGSGWRWPGRWPRTAPCC
jgi:NitT/TauT family transport system ATP-binding protein